LIFFLVSLLVAAFIGLTLIHICFPLWKNGALLFKICLGTGLGLGITSCVLFLSLFVTSAQFVLLPESFLTFLALGCWWFMTRKKKPIDADILSGRRERFAYTNILSAFLVAGLLSSVASFILAVVREPHGKWDAWLIWNMHARFIFRAGEHWQDYFASGLYWTHPDYPLMLPLSIVRSWKYMGIESPSIPILLSFLFMFALIGLIVSSLTMLRGKNQGYLGGLVLIGSPFFILMGASQLADIPLAFFLLASIVLLFLYDQMPGGHHRLLVLSGVAAGLLAWTKNEGILIALMLILVRFFVVTGAEGWKSAVKQVSWLMVGVLPVLLLTASFKVMLAPTTDIFAGQNIQVIGDRLTDIERFKTIIGAYIQTGLTFTQGIPDIRTGFRFNPGVAGIALLALYLVLSGTEFNRKDKVNILHVLLVTLVTLGGYFLIYLITPHNLEWHLITSLNRLFIQLWPAIILITFVAARTPEMVFPQDQRRREETRSVSEKPGKRKSEGR